MVIVGINVIDADSLDAASDLLDEIENWIDCPECDGARSITDYSPSHGYIDIECPCCEGNGMIVECNDDSDPEPPTPAAPALAVIVPFVRCATCRDTGRTVKPSTLFAGKTIEGFCPDCRPHYDFAVSRFVNCGGNHAGEVTPPPTPAPVRFDRAAHCRRIGSLGGAATVAKHGRWHMPAIGTAGARVTIARHGHDYWRGLMTAKRATPRRAPDLLADLAAGRDLAALKRAA